MDTLNSSGTGINLVKLSTSLEIYEQTNVLVTADQQSDKEVIYTATTGNNDSVQKHSLIISNLSYSIRNTLDFSLKRLNDYVGQTKRNVLADINMVLYPGKITALLGSSGSGKTSLLDIISQKHTGNITGKVTLGGKQVTKETFRSKMGYVLQDDNLTNMPHLTAGETLFYMASIQFRGLGLSKEDKWQKVEKVMRDMKIWHVKDVKVGGHVVRGLSGGEKRRTCIAAQLLLDPDVLILDEPTTGLDSFTAHEIIKTLAELAHKRNKVVFLTIHQPSSDIFPLLDYLAILSCGQLVYFGKQEEIIGYLDSINYPCPENSNPLDHAVTISSIDRRSTNSQNRTESSLNYLVSCYNNSNIYSQVKEQCITNKIEGTTSTEQLFASKQNKLSLNWPSIWLEICVIPILLRRLYLNVRKDRASLIMRSLSLTVMAPFLWIFLPYLGHDLTSLQDRTGVLYISIAIPPTVGVLNAVSLFTPVRNQFNQEYAEGLYGVTAFLSAFYTFIIPFHIISSLTFSVWVYYSVEMYPEFSRFLIYLSTVFLTQYIGEVTTMLMLATVHKPAIAQSLVTVIHSVSTVLASGIIKATGSLVDPVRWLTYITFIKYSSEILVANEYNGLEFECENNGTVQPCRGIDGNTYLEYMFPGSVENMGRNFGLLTAFIALSWTSHIIVCKLKFR